MIEVFCSCAPSEQKYLEELVLRLRPLADRQLIQLWESSFILPGDDWATEHNKHLNSAQVILFLISPSFLTSSLHTQEVQVALNLREQQKAYIIPILLRHVNLEDTPLGELTPLPSPGNPILSSKNLNRHDEIMFQVTEGIIRTIKLRFQVSSTQNLQLSDGTLPTWEQPFDQAAFKHVTEYTKRKLEQFRYRQEKHKSAWNRRKTVTESVAVLTWLLIMIDLWTQALKISPLIQLTLIFLTAISATVGGICIWSLTQAYNFGRWLHYQRQLSDLKNEKKMFEQEQGIYALNLDKKRVFRERVSDIMRNTGGGTRSDDETKDYLPS